MPSSHHKVVVEKIADFHEMGVPEVFPRDLSLGEIVEPKAGNIVQVVVGMRRCGKTYRLYQEIQRILDLGYPLDSILYFNFDDERLKPYESNLLDDVVESFFALNPRAKKKGAFFFFDEIQEIPDWGVFMRRMVDTQKATIYATGSSSKMLSTHLATEFRGRSLSRELFPMSFSEFLRFHGNDVSAMNSLPGAAMSATTRAHLRNACSQYLRQGGFIATQQLEPSDASQLLQEYANRTVSFDIIERYGVKNPRAVSLFLTRCLASSGRELSINKIHNDFKSRGISIGRDTLASLLAYYEEAYMLFSIRNYSTALASNPRSVSKVYAADPALFSAFSPAASTDAGQRLETAVFNKIRRQVPSWRVGAISRGAVSIGGKQCEIDFVIDQGVSSECAQLIQVSLSMDEDETREREFRALRAGMQRFGVDESTIVTMDEEGEEATPSGTIHIIPAWKWLV